MTVEQIDNEILDNLNSKILDSNPVWEGRDPTVEGLIKFAQYHVQQALEAAAQKAKIINVYKGRDWGFTGAEISESVVDKDSILNAYPLTNIK